MSRDAHDPVGADPLRAVALDLDGTILEGGAVIRADLVDILLDLRNHGMTCVTASGRPVAFQIDILDRFGLGAASGCFAALVADERDIFLLDADSRPTGTYRPCSAWNGPIHRRWAGLSDAATCWAQAALDEARRRGYVADLASSPRELLDRGMVTLAFEDPQQAAAVGSWLAPRLAAADAGLACDRNVRLVQVYDATVGKGPTLAKLAEILSIRPGEILAIGDTFNDRLILDGSLGFVPATVANAEDGLKALVAAAGGYVAGRAYGAGVIEVLGRALAGRGPELALPDHPTESRPTR